MEEIKNVTELMKRMKNPLDNEELYYKLFDIVYQSEGPGLKFSQIFNYDLNTEKKGTKEYGLKANYSLMKMQISILLKHIEKMDENEFQNYITTKLSNRAPSQKKDKYIEYLQKLHDLTFDEWIEVLKKNDNNFFSVYYALVDNSNVNYLGFKYIRSYQIAPTRKEQIHSKDVKHRLYVTMDYSQLYKFVTKFVKTLEANYMPYNMKVETHMGLRHNDVLVIYIDNEINLLKTINIINGLIDRNLEYQDKLHTPSEHLFNIDDRIGYGFEPPSKDSYSNVLGYTLYDSKEEACKQIVESLINDYPNKTYMGYKQEFIEAAKNENYSSIIHQKLLKEKNIGKHKYLLYVLMKLIRPKVEEEINNSQGIDMNDVFNINSKAKTL